MIYSRGERIKAAWVALSGGQKVTGNGRYRDRSETEKKGIGNEWKKCVEDS